MTGQSLSGTVYKESGEGIAKRGSIRRGQARRRIADAWIALFVRKRFYRFWSLIHEASLHGIGVLNYRGNGTGERAFLRWLVEATRQREGPHWILDVGANVGNYAANVRAALPAADIVCFEPHPRTAERLRQRAAALRLDVVATAVGREPGELELYDYAATPAGSEHATFYPDVIVEPNGHEPARFLVPVTTVDAVLAARGIERVLLLKIDTEGHELAVLEGARSALNASAIDIVQLEFNEMNVVSRTFFRDLLAPLDGYRLFRLLPDGFVPLHYSPRKTEIFGFQNIVAIREGFMRHLLSTANG